MADARRSFLSPLGGRQVGEVCRACDAREREVGRGRRRAAEERMPATEGLHAVTAVSFSILPFCS